jgi:hypothetical protein
MVCALLIGNYIELNKMIGEKLNAKLSDPEFIKRVVSEIKPRFLIFDENQKILLKSKGVLNYIDPDGIKIEKSGREIVSIKIKTKEYMDFPPVLTSLDENIFFKEPERPIATEFVYNTVELASGKWAVAYKDKPPIRFKFDIIVP